MEGWLIIRDIVVLLAAALVLGVLFERLRQSVIVGSLVAGTLVGLFGLVQSEDLDQLAELGVALLLFTIGLELSWTQLRSYGWTPVIAAVLQIIVTMAVGAGIARLMGFSWPAAVALGAVVSLSSTATVLRTLQERGEVESMHGRMALSILLVQDMAVVPLVLLVTFLGHGGDAGGDVVEALGSATGKAGLLIAVLLLGGLVVLPRLLNLTALTRNRELPVLLAVVTWLASTWAAHALGLSPALATFIAGMLLAGSPFAAQIRADLAPFRIAFVTLFFASLGLLADLRWLFVPEHLLKVLLVAAAIIIGKAVIAWAVLRPLGAPNRGSLAAGISLANIGEFSFVLAVIARSNGAFDSDTFLLIVSSTLVTLLVTPVLVNNADGLSAWIERKMVAVRLWSAAPRAAEADPERMSDHVIVVGFGPAGQAVVAAVREAGLDLVVLDLNPRSVAAAQSRGLCAVLGDSTQRETLEHVGVDRARACVITIPDHRSVSLTSQQVRSIAPGLATILRARYHAYAAQLRAAGATVLIDEEEAVGRLLADEALRIARAAPASSG